MQLPEDLPSCSCDRCQKLCARNPGWFLPGEAKKAILAGYADRLMRDWLEPCSEVGNKERVYILAPAAEGCEGWDAPTWEEMAAEAGYDGFGALAGLVLGTAEAPSKGQCVLQDSETGLCEIHDTDFKPVQCRTAFARGCDEGKGSFASNYEVAEAWHTDEGREVLELWYDTLRQGSEGLR